MGGSAAHLRRVTKIHGDVFVSNALCNKARTPLAWPIPTDLATAQIVRLDLANEWGVTITKLKVDIKLKL